MEIKYEMTGGIDMFGEVLFSTAVRYRAKPTHVFTTLCFVDQDGHVGWLDKPYFEDLLSKD